jgi:hypothetical protein
VDDCDSTVVVGWLVGWKSQYNKNFDSSISQSREVCLVESSGFVKVVVVVAQLQQVKVDFCQKLCTFRSQSMEMEMEATMSVWIYLREEDEEEELSLSGSSCSVFHRFQQQRQLGHYSTR